MRSEAEQGDLQVNLVDKNKRSDKSHAIAQRLRPELEKIGLKHRARIQVVEVPPGPPVMSPLVAEVYGPDEAGRQQVAERIAKTFAATADIVGVDTSNKENAPRAYLRVRHQRSESLGIPVSIIAQSAAIAALSGTNATYLHDGQSKYQCQFVCNSHWSRRLVWMRCWLFQFVQPTVKWFLCRSWCR